MTATEWRAIHVHRHAEQDRFLTGALAPVLADLRAEGVLYRWFFLRYWQGGPHIRVRLLLAAHEADAVRERTAGRLRAALRATPVDAPFDAEHFLDRTQPMLAALEGAGVDVLHPPDTVRASAYHPEYGKYGGAAGVAIAEELFAASSAAVLEALPRVGGVSARRIGAAFTATVRGLIGAGLDAAAMARFFAHYCTMWAPYVFDEFLAAWPALVEARSPLVRAHAAALLDGPGDPAVRRALERVDDAVLDAVTLLGPAAPAERRRQVLLVGYLHTHNNRLGLSPEQEAFLGILGHHALSGCAGQDPDQDLIPRLRRHREERLAGAV